MSKDASEVSHHLDAHGSEPHSPERQSFLDLTQSPSLPLDQAAAALEKRCNRVNFSTSRDRVSTSGAKRNTGSRCQRTSRMG
jgi:hypothetical protein